MPPQDKTSRDKASRVALNRVMKRRDELVVTYLDDERATTLRTVDRSRSMRIDRWQKNAQSSKQTVEHAATMSEERGGVRPAAHSETGEMSSGPRAATFGRDRAEAKEAGVDGNGLRWQVCASPDELEVKWEAEALEEVLAPRWRRHLTTVAAQTAERSGNVVPLDILPVHAFDMVSDESLASLASWLKLEFASHNKSALGELEFAQFVAATVYLESQHTSLPRALQTMLAEAQRSVPSSWLFSASRFRKIRAHLRTSDPRSGKRASSLHRSRSSDGVASSNVSKLFLSPDAILSVLSDDAAPPISSVVVRDAMSHVPVFSRQDTRATSIVHLCDGILQSSPSVLFVIGDTVGSPQVWTELAKRQAHFIGVAGAFLPNHANIFGANHLKGPRILVASSVVSNNRSLNALLTVDPTQGATHTFVDFDSGHADLFARTFCMEKEDLGPKMSSGIACLFLPETEHPKSSLQVHAEAILLQNARPLSCSTSSADARILRQFAFTSTLSSQILQDDPELRELLGVSLDGTPCLDKDDQAKFIAETLVKAWTKPNMSSSYNETADNAIESLRSMTWIEEIYEIGVLQSLEHTGMVAAPDALVRIAYPSQDRGDQGLGTSHFACVLTCIMPPKSSSSSSSSSSGNNSSVEESLSSHITEFGDTSMERPMGFLIQCTCGDRTWWDMLCTKSRAQVLHMAAVSGLARVLVVLIAHQYPYEVKGYLLVETTPQARERYSQTLEKWYASHLAWAHESLDHPGPPPVVPEVFAEVALQCDLDSHFKLWRAVRKYIQTCAGPLHPVRSLRPAIETVVSALTQENSYHVFRDKRFASQVSPSDSVECGQDIESRLAVQCIRDLARVSHGLFLMLSAIKEVLPFAHDPHRDFANCLLRHFSQQPGWADFTAELGVQLLARAQDNQQQLPMQQHSGSKAHIPHDVAETDGAIDPPSPPFPSSDVAEAKRVMQRRPKRGPNVLRFYNDQAKRFRLDRTLAHHPMRNELVAGGKFDVNGEPIDDPASALKPKELTCVLCRRRATYHCSICQAVLHTRVPRGHTKSCFTIFHDDPVLSGTS